MGKNIDYGENKIADVRLDVWQKNIRKISNGMYGGIWFYMTLIHSTKY